MIAFVGATAYEAQVGRLWIKILRPKWWSLPYRNSRTKRLVFPSFIRIGLEKAK